MQWTKLESQPQLRSPRTIYHNCKKKGHFAKICKSAYPKRSEVKEIAEQEETEQSDTDKSINLLTETKHLTGRLTHITMTVKIDGTEKRVDAGSLVTIMLLDRETIQHKENLPITRENQEIIKNEVIFAEKITVEAENGGIRKKLPILITEREDIKPLLGMDWLQKSNSTIRNIGSTTNLTDRSELNKKVRTFGKLFKTDRTIKHSKTEI